jgi:chemotaxis protein MotB
MNDEAGKDQPIIIIKKGGGHHGHHGGAWKVAYADFVTAMMALFMVLWLLSSSEETQKAIGGYFQDPSGNGKLVGSNMAGSGGEAIDLPEKDMDKIKDKLESAMRESAALQKVKDQITMVVTGEGLRIELVESDVGTFFESGSPVPTTRAIEVLGTLAREIGKLPNKIFIEGHTDASRFSGVYSNWELSADRANTTRRIMTTYGVGPDQVEQVRGFAAQKLRKPKEPEDASNRRVSIIVQHLESKPGAKPPAGAKEDAAKADAKSEHDKPGDAKAEEHPAAAKDSHDEKQPAKAAAH